MDQTYINLFKELARAMEITAERAMEYNNSIKDEKGYETSKIMRDDYSKLYDKISAPEFVSSMFSRAEFAKLLVGAYVISQDIEQRIASQKKALNGYKLDILPKLDRIMNETKNDDEALHLAEKIFQVKEEN